MKVLLVNGSPHNQGCTYTALSEIANTLNAEGIETEIFWIGIKPLSGCMGCGYCNREDKCVFNDSVNLFAEKAREADGFIRLTSSLRKCRRRNKFIYGPAVLFIGRCSCLQASSWNSKLPTWRSKRHIRPAEQIFHNKLHAYSFINILERSTRQQA